MKKLITFISILVALVTIHAVQAAPTSTRTSNLFIDGIKGGSTLCLNIDSTGLVGVAAANCGTGGSVTFRANGGAFVTTSTIDIQQGANITITTSTTGVYTITGSAGGGSGGVATSGSPVAGQVTFFFDPNTIMGSTGFTYASTTKVLTVGTGTITGLTFTNASGTNESVSGYGLFPTLNFTNASGTNISLSGYLQGGSLNVTQASTSNLTSAGYLQGATLQISGASTLANVSSTNVSASGYLQGASGAITNVSSTNISASGYLQGGTLSFTNGSGTNMSVSGYGLFPTLNYTNASGTNLTATGYLQTANVSSTNVFASGYLQGGTLNVTQASTSNLTSAGYIQFVNASGTNISVSGYGLLPTLAFTNASGTNITLSGYAQGANGNFTNVSSTRIDATTGGTIVNVSSTRITAGTSFDGAKINVTNVSSTNIDNSAYLQVVGTSTLIGNTFVGTSTATAAFQFVASSTNGKNYGLAGTSTFNAVFPLGGTIAWSVTSTGNGAAASTSLMTYTVPTSTYEQLGDNLHIVAGGTFANTASANKQIQVVVSSTVIFDSSAASGAIPANAAGNWKLDIDCTRQNTTSTICISSWTDSANSALTDDSGDAGNAVALVNMTSTIPITIYGNATNANDVIANNFRVRYDPSP